MKPGFGSALGACGFALLLQPFCLRAENLVANGSFDAQPDPLTAWQTTYTQPGDSWYADNASFISVLPREGGRKDVLRLHGTDAVLNVPGQGVKLDSRPIPITLDGKRKYRLSAWARSTGPTCRVMLEGYHWQAKVTPHPDPALHELRKCYRFNILPFGTESAVEMASVPRNWTKGTYTFPEPTKSALQQQLLEKIAFVVIHVVAVGGGEGDLFLDDIKLEALGPERARAPLRPPSATPSGSTP